MSNINLTCKTCNKEFVTDFKYRNRIYCSRTCYFSDPECNVGKRKDIGLYVNRICPVCFKEFNIRKKDKRKICSSVCRIEYNKIHKEERIQKSKLACIEKYGVESTFNLEKFRYSALEAFKIKYNEDTPMHVKSIVTKVKNTFEEKRVINYITRAEKCNFNIIEIINPLNVTLECSVCKNIFNYTQLKNNRNPICRKCFPITKNNTISDLFENIFIENNIKYEKNNRSLIKPKEIDFLVNNKSIGFEINGNYWHSEYYGGKDKDYHINKTIIAEKNNCQLIHIFEDEIVKKFDIVKSRIFVKLGLIKNKIYARKCTIKEVSFTEEKMFLNKTHIQGYVKSGFRYGLYYNDELVSVMSFIKNRCIKRGNVDNDKYELLRFSNKLNTIVIGGFSKLLKHFCTIQKGGTIMTYSDIRWNGYKPYNNIYSNCGFKFIKKIEPNYWYVNTNNFNERKHRFNFRKDILVKQGFDKNKSERLIMFENGYDRIWDCGCYKYELEFTVTPTNVGFDNIT